MSARARTARPVVFDSFALTALLEKQPGWEIVRQTLRDLGSARRRGILSLVNWGEVYYIAVQRTGRDAAKATMKQIARLPVDVAAVDQVLTERAAVIKGERPVSYADAFCVATAEARGAKVVTGDPEFEHVEDLIDVVWLPRRRRRERR